PIGISVLVYIILIIFFVLAILFWELIVSEGTHLGRRFVVWLYDLAANQYERIKQFDSQWERRFLAEPVAQVLGSLEDPLVLDVGAGTGRLAKGLFQLPDVRAKVICLEPSVKMGNIGRNRTPDHDAQWVRAWAVPLPFPDGSFDLVASLEILEFTPDPWETLSEMARVLRKDGFLLVTNRVGREARWIFGKTFSRKDFPDVLEQVGFDAVEVFPWQVTYDLVWARRRNEDFEERLHS
ncbi:MAG: class I SAM-dependent methyltransferase, partial [Anaerolineales bacterium]